MNLTPDSLSQWADGETRVNEPWLAYMSTTNVCNSRCSFCAHNEAMRKERGVMTLDTARRIIEQLPRSVTKIYLQKQGEPFLNPHLGEIVKLLKKERPEISLALHTNVIGVTEKKAQAVIPDLDAIGLSISATDRETYKTVHGVDKFDLVCDRLKTIDKALSGIDTNSRPHVFVDFVKCHDNQHIDKNEATAFLKKLCPSINSVDFHALYNFQGYIEEGNLEVYDKLPYADFPCCVFPWASITFCHDGKVSYCFVEPQEKHFLGDIMKQDFEQVWNGTSFRQFRADMVGRRFERMEEAGYKCSKCSWLWAMQSQSPKNLTCGYSAATNNNRSLTFTELLSLPQEQLVKHGINSYNKGEIHIALGCFELYASMVGEPGESVREYTRRCRQVISMYEKLPLWQEALSTEGKTTENTKNEYRNVSE